MITSLASRAYIQAPTMVDKLQPFIVAFIIGLLIGIERERSHPAGVKAIGVRTFVLIALLGALAAWVDEIVVSISLSVFALGAILLGYFQSAKLHKQAVGITTEVAAGVVFCLGYIAHLDPFLSGFLALAVLIVLLGREHLHRFSRTKINPGEIRAAATILVIIIGIIPFLPNHTIDPWELFNPRRFGILVVLIALMQFGGYVGVRIFGHQYGMIFTGFFGGLVSSTAVFATLPGLVKHRPGLLRPAIGAGIVATIATLLEVIVVLLVIAPDLLETLWLPMSLMMLTGVVATFFVVFRRPDNTVIESPSNPLDFKSVCWLSFIIGGMLILVAVAKRYAGTQAVWLVSFLGGLFELHSVTFANATLYIENKIIFSDAIVAVGFALIASFVTKFILLTSLAHDRFAFYTSLALVAMLLSGFLGYLYF